MRLTSFTDYSIRVLMYSATKGDELTSIREVSEIYNISSNHLMKVIHHLGKGGYLHTVRGKNGGFRLGKKASEIKISEIIEYTEEDMNIVACFDTSHKKCTLKGNCRFEAVMKEALNAFLGVADQYTLADLISDNQ